ncbi:TetR/AcrR family transcriptional regulator [Spirillospora sp. NPDC052242]
MPQPSAQRKGRPPRFSRAEIVETARRIVDAEGVDRLTMRRLAQEIGGTPMALYHHVRDKEQLLVLLLDDYAARNLHRPDLPDDPRERVVVVAAAIRRTLASCPWIVEVLTADDLMSQEALWFVEQIMDSLIECGLTPEEAVYGYRAVWYYTAGEMIVRAAGERRRASDDRPTYRERVFADVDAAELPRVAGVAGRWAELTAEDTYLDGLRALVGGLVAGAR